MAVRVFQEYYQYMTSYQYLLANNVAIPASTDYIIRISIIPVIILFFIPIILSGLLTRLVPEKIIVPPLYIQMVTLAGIVIFALSNLSVIDWVTPLLLGVAYTMVGGQVQDRTTTALVGISSNRGDIVTSTIEVLNATPDEIVRILSEPKFADNLVVSPHAEERNGVFMFRNPRGTDYETRIEVRQLSSSGKPTIINLAFFEREKYYLRYSTELVEYARAIHVYLYDLLQRSNSTVPPQQKLSVQVPDETHSALLVDQIIDETQGWWVGGFKQRS